MNLIMSIIDVPDLPEVSKIYRFFNYLKSQSIFKDINFLSVLKASRLFSKIQIFWRVVQSFTLKRILKSSTAFMEV